MSRPSLGLDPRIFDASSLDLAVEVESGPENVWRLKFEDSDLEPLDDYDVYLSKTEVLAAFAAVVADPPSDIGSVYVTFGEDDIVVASHTFV
ncbi:MAG TPA: hypothetical protein VNG12_03650 [Acidimicrobiales bacterium]|nr:hypothetical protein [Acidimicrobiales bacterium]